MSKPRSLSLAAYRVLSWGVANTGVQPTTPRPEGELLWIHVNSRDRLKVIDDICQRILEARPGLSLLLTAPPDADLAEWTDCNAPILNLPVEQASAARGFLQHWRPTMGLWVGGGLMPNIITQASESHVPLILIEAQPEAKPARSGRWLPDITRFTLDCFQQILAPTDEVARQIRRLGIPSDKITVSPRLRVSPVPHPWPEDELIEANHMLAGRPVWVAAWVRNTEFISVLTAHQQAMRMLPRLALILHVADKSEMTPLQQRLEAMDLRCASWDDGQPVEDTTQVILSAVTEDLGLWHRVSSVSFMGNSLERGAGGHDPLISTALGSAVVHGPHVQDFKESYDQLDQAGAAMPVRSATELGDAVVAMLAPDRSANMALAGWQVVTDGAPQSDQVVEMVLDVLDRQEAAGARP